MRRLSCLLLLSAAACATDDAATNGAARPSAVPPSEVAETPAEIDDAFPTAGLVLPEGLSLVATFDEPPGNVTVTPEGRVFVSLHQWFNPTYRVVELMEDGSTVPYPNEDWATKPEGPGDQGLIAVLGLRSDLEGVVWMLDNASQDGQLVGTPKLVGWDTRTDELAEVIEFSEGAYTPKSFMNDLAVDPERGVAYVSDSGASAVVVVDLESGETRRVLEGARSTKPEEIPLTVDGQVIVGMADGRMRNAYVGSDPITIDPDLEHVYFGPLSGRTTYRVEADLLADPTVSASELEAAVEPYAERPQSDGETIDSAGNLYITDIGNDAIGVATPQGYRVLFQGPAVSWPDGFSAALDDEIYVTVNRLHQSPFLDPEKQDDPDRPDSPDGPTYLLKFDALAPIPIGR